MTYGRTWGRTGISDRLLAPLRTGGQVVAAAALMAGWLALLWVLEAVDVISGHRLDTFGIVPRRSGELLDIVPSAFVHFGFAHLASNSLPLLVLGFIAALRGIGRYLAVAFAIIVVDGMGVWLFSPAHTNTAGASGLIFGLFSYLLIRGFVDHRVLDVVVGVAIGALLRHVHRVGRAADQHRGVLAGPSVRPGRRAHRGVPLPRAHRVRLVRLAGSSISSGYTGN